MMAWPVRVAAALAILQGAGHAMLVLTAKATQPSQSTVVDAMRGHAFVFSGVHRTYWDLYTGYALLAAGVCFIEAALLWIIAPMASYAAPAARKLLAVVIFANLSHMAMMARYFFPLPAVFDGAIIVLLFAAIVSRGPRAA
jgi:hypothetical protein